MKKISRSVLVMIMALLLVVSLAACGKPAANNSSSDVPAGREESAPETSSISLPESEEPISEPSSVADSGSEAAVVDTGEMSDAWDSYEVMIDGVVYAFPCSPQDFVDNGWAIDPGSDGATMPANTLTSVDFTKGDSELTLTVINNESNATPVLECTAAGITVDSWDMGDMSFAIPGGFTFGASAADIQAAYGEPTEFYEKSGGEIGSLTYGPAAQSYYIGFFDGGFSDIRILVK